MNVKNIKSEVKGKPGATLNREMGFVSSSRSFCARGRGEAASVCEVQSVPPGPASTVGSSPAVPEMLYPEMLIAYPNLYPEMLIACVLRWFYESPS